MQDPRQHREQRRADLRPAHAVGHNLGVHRMQTVEQGHQTGQTAAGLQLAREAVHRRRQEGVQQHIGEVNSEGPGAVQRPIERVAPHRQRAVQAVVAIRVAQVARGEEPVKVPQVVEPRVVANDPQVVVDIAVGQAAGESERDNQR